MCYSVIVTMAGPQPIFAMAMEHHTQNDHDITNLWLFLSRLPYDLSTRVGKSKDQNKRQCVLNPYLIAYLRLFGMLSSNTTYTFIALLVSTEDEIIQDFLWIDSCAKLADKVGMVINI